MTVYAWQLLLKSHGFNPGTPDGVYGPKTDAAAVDCRAWQAFLKEHGLYSGEIDGRPGSLTDAAIKMFQRLAGIRDDGVVDPTTRLARETFQWNPAAPPPNGESLTGHSGVDYSLARPGGAAIKAKGYTFVARYLSHTPAKNLSVAELTGLRQNGLAVVLVWETTADRALAGSSGGFQDGSAALAQAQALGVPDSAPIYFAVDFDAGENQQKMINDYLTGAAHPDVLGAERVGVYGGYRVVKRCLDAEVATYAWQTAAWSHGQLDARVHIYQTGGKDFNGQVDIDVAKQDHIGEWR